MTDAGETVGCLGLLEGEEEVHVLYWSLRKAGVPGDGSSVKTLRGLEIVVVLLT